MESNSREAEMPQSRCKFKIRLPDTRNALRRLTVNLVAFTSCCSLVMFVAFFLLLILQTMLIVYWAKFFRHITHEIPKTFSWEILIRLFGSSYNDCIDWSTEDLVRLTLPDHCSYDFSVPAIPIVALIFLIGSAFYSILCCVEDFLFQNSNLSLKVLWMFCFGNLAFSLGAVIYISSSMSGEKGPEFILHRVMNSEMKSLSAPTYITPHWNLTQLTHGCCGVSHFTEWNFKIFEKGGNPRYPRSCCDHSKFACKFYPNRTEVWKNGCFDAEYAVVKRFAMAGIYLLCMGFLSTLLITFLITVMYTIYKGSTYKIKCCSINNNFLESNLSSVFKSLNHDKPKLHTGDNDLPNKVVSHHYQNTTHVQNNTGAGDHATVIAPILLDDENSEIIQPQQINDRYNRYIVRRDNYISININSWGIHIKSKSTSIAQTHVLKKETAV